MRIIRGNHRGKILRAPSSLPVRPTTDMAKEGLFNVLENRVDWSDVLALDLFAGTGNLSYELASRGCPDVTAVDSFRDCTRFIAKTSEQLQFPIRALTEDALRFLQKNPGRWDLILADPPYDFALHAEVTDAALNRLSPEGLFVLEHGADTDLSSHPQFTQLRRYGSVHFSFFEGR
ncbi:MAG: RsmD family RNA methyltransferase [Schleiferiaceae bacterium]